MKTEHANRLAREREIDRLLRIGLTPNEVVMLVTKSLGWTISGARQTVAGRERATTKTAR